MARETPWTSWSCFVHKTSRSDWLTGTFELELHDAPARSCHRSRRSNRSRPTGVRSPPPSSAANASDGYDAPALSARSPARRTSASNNACCDGSVGAVSSGCHCTPTSQPGSVLSRLIASTSPSLLCAGTVSPHPRGDPLVMVRRAPERRHRRRAAELRFLRRLHIVHRFGALERNAVLQQAFDVGEVLVQVPPNATFSTCAPRQIQSVGIAARSAACSSAISTRRAPDRRRSCARRARRHIGPDRRRPHRRAASHRTVQGVRPDRHLARRNDRGSAPA